MKDIPKRWMLLLIFVWGCNDPMVAKVGNRVIRKSDLSEAQWYLRSQFILESRHAFDNWEMTVHDISPVEGNEKKKLSEKINEIIYESLLQDFSRKFPDVLIRIQEEIEQPDFLKQWKKIMRDRMQAERKILKAVLEVHEDKKDIDEVYQKYFQHQMPRSRWYVHVEINNDKKQVKEFLKKLEDEEKYLQEEMPNFMEVYKQFRLMEEFENHVENQIQQEDKKYRDCLKTQNEKDCYKEAKRRWWRKKWIEFNVQIVDPRFQ